MAGVPSVFSKMLDVVLETLPNGPVLHKIDLFTMEREGEIATFLQEAERCFEGLMIGSYPRDGSHVDPNAPPGPLCFNVRISLSSFDPELLSQAEEYLRSLFPVFSTPPS